MREIRFKAILEGKTHFTAPFDWYDLKVIPAVETIVQFTGLRDKNGKEIYEGDLVHNNDYVWEVTWRDGAVYIENRTQGKGKWWIGGENEHSEIIGNIYENPDLIK